MLAALVHSCWFLIMLNHICELMNIPTYCIHIRVERNCSTYHTNKTKTNSIRVWSKWKYNCYVYYSVVKTFILKIISSVYDLEIYIFLIVYFPPRIYNTRSKYIHSKQATLSFRGLKSFPRKEQNRNKKKTIK